MAVNLAGKKDTAKGAPSVGAMAIAKVETKAACLVSMTAARKAGLTALWMANRTVEASVKTKEHSLTETTGFETVASMDECEAAPTAAKSADLTAYRRVVRSAVSMAV